MILSAILAITGYTISATVSTQQRAGTVIGLGGIVLMLVNLFVVPHGKSRFSKTAEDKQIPIGTKVVLFIFSALACVLFNLANTNNDNLSNNTMSEFYIQRSQWSYVFMIFSIICLLFYYLNLKTNDYIPVLVHDFIASLLILFILTDVLIISMQWIVSAHMITEG